MAEIQPVFEKKIRAVTYILQGTIKKHGKLDPADANINKSGKKKYTPQILRKTRLLVNFAHLVRFVVKPKQGFLPLLYSFPCSLPCLESCFFFFRNNLGFFIGSLSLADSKR